MIATLMVNAQRRPALPGRQPPDVGRLCGQAALLAQRRPALPGRQPLLRRCATLPYPYSLNEGRPFRAGNPVAAMSMRRSCAYVAALNEGRPFRAGNPMAGRTTSQQLATPPVSAQRRPALPGRQPPTGAADRLPDTEPTLNEGRPFRAGNPLCSHFLCWYRLITLNEGRPFRAGNPADRRSNARRRRRSTKAGPSGPATPGLDVAQPNVGLQR